MQPVVDGIDAELRAAGKSTISAIAEILNARGYTTRRGKQWRAQSVKRIIERSS
ncbi:MAG: recombinase family protein [Rhodospirillales bacterium]|nr:recombinase family protein [Rhodospirillales bacterium]